RKMPIILYACLSGTILCAIAAYLTWSVRIHRYVEMYRCEPALFLLPWAPLIDFRKARRIAKKLGRTPGVLKWYRTFEVTAGLFAVGSVVAAILWQIRVLN